MNIRVLVADDHAIVRDGLIALIAAQPDLACVGSAASGQETLAQVPLFAPEVVILDISMPDLDGIEVTRRLIQDRPQLRVIILSMHGDAEFVFRALEAGARGYLLKESAGREIVDAVRKVHAGRRYLSPAVAEIVAEGLGAQRAASPVDSLSRREREIVRLVANGESSAAIGARLHLSPKTVDTYRSRAMQKLGVADMAGLIKFAIQHGLATLP